MYIDRSPLTVTCTSFFTVLMRVDKTGLQFYFFLFPFFNSKHFFPNSFYDSVADSKKKKKRKKGFVSKCSIFIFYSLIFIRVYRIVGFWSCRFELLL